MSKKCRFKKKTVAGLSQLGYRELFVLIKLLFSEAILFIPNVTTCINN